MIVYMEKRDCGYGERAIPRRPMSMADPPGECFHRNRPLDVPGVLYPTITLFCLYFTIIGGRAVWRQYEPDGAATQIRPDGGIKKDADTRVACKNEICVPIAAPNL